jgi:hypothetical protein
MIVCVKPPYGAEIEAGDKFMPVRSFFLPGGYEVRVIRRISDGRRFDISQRFVSDEEYFVHEDNSETVPDKVPVEEDED